MNAIWTHDLSPFLVSFQWNGQTVGLRWYGLAYVLSFALGYFALRRAALRGEIEGLNERALEKLAGALMLGVVLGGRVGFVLQNLTAWRTDPLFRL